MKDCVSKIFFSRFVVSIIFLFSLATTGLVTAIPANYTELKKAISDLKNLVVTGFNQWKADPKAQTPVLLDNLGFQVAGKIPAQTITLLKDSAGNPSIQLVNPTVAQFAALPENWRGYILQGKLVFGGESFDGQFFTLQAKDAAGNPTGDKFRGIGFRTSGDVSVTDLLATVNISAPDLKALTLPSVNITMTDNFGDDKSFKYNVPYVDAQGNQAAITLEAKPGISFAASMKMDGVLADVQKLKNRIEKTQFFTLTGGAPTLSVQIPYPLTNISLEKIAIRGSLPWQFGVDFDVLRQQKRISTDVDKYFKLKSFTIGDLFVDITATAQVTLSGKAWLGLTTQADKIMLGVSGGFGPQSSEFNASMKGMWDPAFGIEWLALGNLGFTIGVNYAAETAAALLGLPFTKIGLTGDLGLGKKDNKSVVAVSVAGGMELTAGTPPKPPFFGFAGSLAETLDIAFIVAWASEILQKESKGSVKALNISTLPEIKVMKGSGIAIATTNATFGAPGFEKGYKQGFSFNMDAIVSGIQGKLNMQLDTDNDKFAGDASLTDIKTDVLEITGLKGTLVIDGKKPENTMMSLAGKINIAKINLITDLQKFIINNKGFDGAFSFKLADLLMLDAILAIDSSNFDGFALDFKIVQNLQIELIKALKKLGELKMQDLDKQIHSIKTDLEQQQKIFDDQYVKAQILSNIETDHWNKVLAQCSKDITPSNPIPSSCLQLPGEAIDNLGALIQQGYYGALKQFNSATTQVFNKIDQLNHDLGATQKLKELIQDALDNLSKAMVKAADAVNVKMAQIKTNGKDLRAGKTPSLSFIADLDFGFWSQKDFKVDNLMFDFKNVPQSLLDLGSQVWNKFGPQIASQAQAWATQAYGAVKDWTNQTIITPLIEATDRALGNKPRPGYGQSIFEMILDGFSQAAYNDIVNVEIQKGRVLTAAEIDVELAKFPAMLPDKKAAFKNGMLSRGSNASVDALSKFILLDLLKKRYASGLTSVFSISDRDLNSLIDIKAKEVGVTNGSVIDQVKARMSLLVKTIPGYKSLAEALSQNVSQEIGKRKPVIGTFTISDKDIDSIVESKAAQLGILDQNLITSVKQEMHTMVRRLPGYKSQ